MMATAKKEAKKPGEILDIFCTSPGPSKLQKPDSECVTAMTYIPPQEMEALLLRAKRAVKDEIKMLKERADIEYAYAAALNGWSMRHKKRLASDPLYDHPEIMIALKDTLNEGWLTATHHNQISNMLRNEDGPITKLKSFHESQFTVTTEPTEQNPGNVLIRFDKQFQEYGSAINACLADVRKAQKSKQKEVQLKAILDKLETQCEAYEDLKSRSGENVKLTQDIAHTKDDISRSKHKYNVAISKRKNRYCRARHNLHQCAREIERLKKDISDWEVGRLQVVGRELTNNLRIMDINLALSLQKSDVLGNCSILSDLVLKCEKFIKPDEIVKKWQQSVSTPFASTTLPDVKTQKSYKKEDIHHVARRLSTKMRPRNWLKNIYGKPKDQPKPKVVRKGVDAPSTSSVGKKEQPDLCTKSENDLRKLQKQIEESHRKGAQSAPRTTIEILSDETLKSDTEKDEPQGSKTPSYLSPRKANPYAHLQNRVGKIVFATCNLNSPKKQPEGEGEEKVFLKAKRGDAIIMQKILTESNLGYGSVKGGIKCGYFQLTQVGLTKPPRVEK